MTQWQNNRFVKTIDISDFNFVNYYFTTLHPVSFDVFEVLFVIFFACFSLRQLFGIYKTYLCHAFH